MKFIETFFQSPEALKEAVFSNIDSIVRSKNLSPEQVDEQCDMKPGTWQRVRADHATLSREVILDTCFGLEIDIEDAMPPLELTKQQYEEVAAHMRREGHGITHFTTKDDIEAI